MAKRKIAIVEQEPLPQEAPAPEQPKRRAARQQTDQSDAPRSSASKIVPLPARRVHLAPTPERVPTVGDLAMLYPSIAAFPGLAMSTVAPSTHTSPRPSQGRMSVRQCLSELRGALADGWEIVQPIFARPLWSVTDDSTTAFNFVLRRDVSTRLLVVPEGRTVERFIRERNLIVDYRR